MEFKKEQANEFSKIKNVYAIISGKGGVGKSSVTSLIATLFQNKGFKVGVMDADITGPSIPLIFGINKEKVDKKDNFLKPIETSTGIKVMSINLLIDNEEAPVIWRGPILNSTVRQFFTHVNWGELDYLFIDLPPGTGDIPLTIMQLLPVDGVFVVTSPQNLVQLIVKKSIHMAHSLDIPILGIIENMSYFQCPNCAEKSYIFGESKVEKVAKELELPVLAQLPIDPELAQQSDRGDIENYVIIKGENYGSFAQNMLNII